MKAIRPREYSDQMIFEGVSKALIKYGYSNLSLSKIAKEAQLSAAALSKRFGSKRGLLLAYYDYLTEITEQSFKAIQQTDLSALNMLKQIFLLWTNQVENPVQFANMTSIYLQNNSDRSLSKKHAIGLKSSMMKSSEFCRSPSIQKRYWKLTKIAQPCTAGCGYRSISNLV